MRRRDFLWVELPLAASFGRRALGVQLDTPLDERARLTEWFGDLAAMLTNDDPAGFLKAFRKEMAGRTRLEINVFALLRAYQVASVADLREIAAEGDERVVKVDWRLSLRPREGSVVTSSKRSLLEIRIEPYRKAWRVKQFGEPDFFAPPAA